MPDEAAWGVLGFKRDTGAVAETSADDPASLLLERGAAGRCDDLSIHSRTIVCKVSGVVTWGGDLEGDG